MDFLETPPLAETVVFRFPVEREHGGLRLDRFLKLQYKRRSRENLKRAIENGIIEVCRTQGAHVALGRLKPSFQVLEGDEVHVTAPKKAEPPVNKNFKVLFEDASLYVIDKPPLLPVHPAGSYMFNTLLMELRSRGLDYYLAHRIDKETSGVLVLTKTKEACAALIRQFSERLTRKVYIAIVHGHPSAKHFEVDAPMARDMHSPIGLKMFVKTEEEGGQASFTSFDVLKSFTTARGAFSVVRCHPKTGRQHQIRVHLNHVGHPLVGDKLYGLDEHHALKLFDGEFRERGIPSEIQQALILPRHALHAEEIEITHPDTGEAMTITSPIPDDLKAFSGVV